LQTGILTIRCFLLSLIDNIGITEKGIPFLNCMEQQKTKNTLKRESSYVLQYTRRKTKWDIISLFRTSEACWCLMFIFHRSSTCGKWGFYMKIVHKRKKKKSKKLLIYSYEQKSRILPIFPFHPVSSLATNHQKSPWELQQEIIYINDQNMHHNLWSTNTNTRHWHMNTNNYLKNDLIECNHLCGSEVSVLHWSQHLKHINTTNQLQISDLH